MLSDPIADMLTRIRNGYLASHKEVEVPYSRVKEEIVKILVKEGFLAQIKVQSSKTEAKSRKIICQLKYVGRRPAITKIIRISKPSLRVYSSWQKIPRVLGGRRRGVVVLSTSKGVMTDKEAKKKGVGGEVICQVW